ncbi:MAG TPA: hypothetical protein VM598_06265 [Bdellovibrionota bacterium]|nr:hypothetical protein [Bdellovibrionota bacterium]
MRTKLAMILLALSATPCLAQGTGGSKGVSPSIWEPEMGESSPLRRQPGAPAPLAKLQTLSGGTVLRVDARGIEKTANSVRASAKGLGTVIAAFERINSRHAAGLVLPLELEIRFLAFTGFEGGWMSGTGYGLPATVYDDALKRLTLGEVLATRAGETQTPALTLGASLHEYGHALFAANAYTRIPELVQLGEMLRQKGSYLKRLEAKRTLTQDGLLCMDNIDELKKVLQDKALDASQAGSDACEEWARTTALLRALQRAIEEHPGYRYLDPYEELFADLVAVIGTSELDPIGDALGITGMDRVGDYLEKISRRSFASCPDLRTIPAHDDHGYFSGARCALGELLRAQRNAVGLHDFLGRALDAIAVDLVDSIRASRARDPVADNERLIQGLRRAIARQ